MSAVRPSLAVPVTAYAVGNALGAGARPVLEALKAGRSGLGAPSVELPFETRVGAFPIDLPALAGDEAAYDSRLTRIALHLVEELGPAVGRAAARWGRERVAVILGSSTGGIRETEGAHLHHARTGRLPDGFEFERLHPLHALSDVVARRLGLTGPAYTLSTACSSSAKVFGAAQRLIASGLVDAALVGGVDTLCQTTLRGFHSLGVLSADACRPFGRDRDGLNIGEGGALLLLEREGEGPARLLGVGETSDAHHMSHPHPEGLGARAAMREALARAGLEASDVDHVNAHGTGTPLNDAIEGAALADLVGPEVPVVSTKGYTGHLLGAAGATEAVFSVLALEHGFVPAGLGAEPLDPALPLRVPRARLDRPVRVVLSNSFAFGGSNACLVFGASA